MPPLPGQLFHWTSDASPPSSHGLIKGHTFYHELHGRRDDCTDPLGLGDVVQGPTEEADTQSTWNEQTPAEWILHLSIPLEGKQASVKKGYRRSFLVVKIPCSPHLFPKWITIYTAL